MPQLSPCIPVGALIPPGSGLQLTNALNINDRGEIVGQAVDTTIVVCFIFYDQPISLIWQIIYSGYLFKVVYEVIATPLTYLVVNSLKRAEGIDFFDRSTNFNPFRLRSGTSASGAG